MKYEPLKNQTFSGEMDFVIAVSLARSYQMYMAQAAVFEAVGDLKSMYEQYGRAFIYANRLEWMANCFLEDSPRKEA